MRDPLTIGVGVEDCMGRCPAGAAPGGPILWCRTYL